MTQLDHNIYIHRVEPKYPDRIDSPALRTQMENLLRAAGYMQSRPFEKLLKAGNTVVIKPNWVLDRNPIGHSIDSLITHTSMIYQVACLAAEGMEGLGTVVIGDSPIQGCKFDRLQANARIPEMLGLLRAKYPNCNFVIEDWRLTIFHRHEFIQTDMAKQTRREGYAEKKQTEYELVTLGADSFVEDIADYAKYFRVTCYDPRLMVDHHTHGRHEYLVNKRVFGADLFINMPKLKTHIKAGLTGGLKNLVGINGHKEFLPHHIKGPYDRGGDCYSRWDFFRSIYDDLYDYAWERNLELSSFKRMILNYTLNALWKFSRILGDPISAGSWSGNETVWRMTLDLNHLLFFSKDASRNFLTIMDGIIAGDGEGPLTPDPKPAGLILMGQNPAYVDAAMAQLMGYNISRIPTVYHAIYNRKSKLAGPLLDDYEVNMIELGASAAKKVPFKSLPNLGFKPPLGWRRSMRNVLDGLDNGNHEKFEQDKSSPNYGNQNIHE